jgi:hypothetical protein
MEIYKALKDMGKKVVAVGILAALPYVCESGCAYTDGYAKAETRQEIQRVQRTAEPANCLETCLSE